MSRVEWPFRDAKAASKVLLETVGLLVVSLTHDHIQRSLSTMAMKYLDELVFL
jgi:hypothetical protein